MLLWRNKFWSFLSAFILLSNCISTTNASFAAAQEEDEAETTAANAKYAQGILDAQKQFGEDAPETAKRKLQYALVLKNEGHYVESETYCRAALAAYEKRSGADSLESAKAQVLLGRVLRHQFRLVEAEVCERKALGIREKTLEPNDPAIADALENLAKVCSMAGREKEAKELYLRALKIADASADQSGKVFIVGNLSSTMIQLGEYKQARELLSPLLETFLKEGEGSRNYYASILTLIGQTYLKEEQYVQAHDYLQRALAIFRKVYQPDHPVTAEVLSQLARCDEMQGRYSLAASELAEAIKAQPLHESNAFARAAEEQRLTLIDSYQPIVDRIHAKSEKRATIPDDLDKNQSLYFSLELSTLKMLKISANAPATQMFEMIYKRRSEKLGPNSPLAAEAALQMAVMFNSLGGHATELTDLSKPGIEAFAVKLLNPETKVDFDFNRTVEMLGGRQSALDFAQKELVCLAYLYGRSSQIPVAENELRLAEQCLLAQKVDSHQNPETDLLSLSSAWRLFGNYQQSRRIIEAVLKASEGKKDNRIKFAALLQLSELFLAQSDLSSAFDHIFDAKSIGVKLYGENGHELIPCYRVIAQYFLATGQGSAAANAAARGMECKNPTNNDTIFFLNVRGFACLSAGDYKAAKTSFEQVLRFCKDDTSNQSEDRSLFTAASAALSEALINLGDNKRALQELDWALSSDQANPTAQGLMASARDCAGLARVEALDGDKVLAARYALQAAGYTDRFLKNGFSQLSFAEQCVFVNVTRQTRNVLLSTCTESENLSQAYGYMMKWKGLLLETLRSQSAISAAIATESAAAKKVVNELITARKNVSEFANGEGEVSVQELCRLEEKQAALERELSQFTNLKSVADPIAGHDVEWFRQLLKPDEAFVDFFTFKSVTTNSQHYLLIAMKAGNGGEPRLFDLGERKSIDDVIARWRTVTTGQLSELGRHGQLREPVSLDDYNALTKAVSQFGPAHPELTAFLGSKVKKFWLCPEAAIARVPWNSLATICGTTGPAICEVDSPREFVQLTASSASPAGATNRVLLAAVTTFKDKPQDDLPGTRKEIAGIKARAEEASITFDLLLDDQATKASVCSKLTKASIAHLSSHGFSRAASSGLEPDDYLPKIQFGMLAAPVSVYLPLADSGIVLAETAGSAKSQQQAVTNLLTAEEIVGLNLTRCRLISLSACETGLGTSLNGQGVLGLRSSLLAAGARSILMSLWSVEDNATGELMQRFYGYLWDRSNPLTESEALKKAQEYVRSQHKWNSPVYWAGWVLAGDGWQSFAPQLSQK